MMNVFFILMAKEHMFEDIHGVHFVTLQSHCRHLINVHTVKRITFSFV